MEFSIWLNWPVWWLLGRHRYTKMMEAEDTWTPWYWPLEKQCWEQGVQSSGWGGQIVTCLGQSWSWENLRKLIYIIIEEVKILKLPLSWCIFVVFAHVLFLTLWRLVAAPEKGTLAMSPIFNLAEPSEYKGLTGIVCLKEYFSRVEESKKNFF